MKTKTLVGAGALAYAIVSSQPAAASDWLCSIICAQVCELQMSVHLPGDALLVDPAPEDVSFAPQGSSPSTDVSSPDAASATKAHAFGISLPNVGPSDSSPEESTLDPSDNLVFAPTFPPDGARLIGEASPEFVWRPGGFERFHVEFSSSPDFSGRPVRETAGFRSATRYNPGERTWSRVREIGRCGRPVFWRVVAKIPGSLGVVSSDRVSWFSFECDRDEPRRAAAEEL